MSKFTTNQAIKVISGTHAGKTGWFNKENPHRPGKCFIWISGPNQRGGHVELTDIEAAQ